MFEHYVIFKARPGSVTQLDEVLDTFANGIRGDITGLEHISWGRNVNKSGLAKGYTHGCLSRMTSAAVFHDHFWDHPAHKVLLDALGEVCEDRFAMDFETRPDTDTDTGSTAAGAGR